MTEPTPKPTDALDSLRTMFVDITGPAHAKCPSCEKLLVAAIAAWEKERVVSEQRRQAAKIDGDALVAIRAALEKIEGEMNVHVESEWATKPRHESDRLWVRVGIVEKWMHELRAARERADRREKEMQDNHVVGRIEEKKAAFLEAAMAYCDAHGAREYDSMMAAYRAIVEAESASKKEDAGT